MLFIGIIFGQITSPVFGQTVPLSCIKVDTYPCVLDEDYIVESALFKYDIYTFSKGYENYYFYDMLGLSDPVRTNLRDQNGNTVMGAFGAMARNSIYFIVISMDDILDLLMQ